jgi:hypothetical protein
VPVVSKEARGRRGGRDRQGGDPADRDGPRHRPPDRGRRRARRRRGHDRPVGRDDLRGRHVVPAVRHLRAPTSAPTGSSGSRPTRTSGTSCTSRPTGTGTTWPPTSGTATSTTGARSSRAPGRAGRSTTPAPGSGSRTRSTTPGTRSAGGEDRARRGAVPGAPRPLSGDRRRAKMRDAPAPAPTPGRGVRGAGTDSTAHLRYTEPRRGDSLIAQGDEPPQAGEDPGLRRGQNDGAPKGRKSRRREVAHAGSFALSGLRFLYLVPPRVRPG